MLLWIAPLVAVVFLALTWWLKRRERCEHSVVEIKVRTPDNHHTFAGQGDYHYDDYCQDCGKRLKCRAYPGSDLTNL